MASSVIGALRVDLGLNSAQFERGAKRSQNTLATMRKQFLGIAAVAGAMGAAISAAALKGAADIDKAAKAARRIDSSIGGFRALELAAGEAGVSVETLADAVQTMDREIAKGSKNAGAALKRLGISAKALEGLDADQKIALIADQIQKMGLSTADASVLLQQLGIRNREMVLAVTAGGSVFRDARRDIEDYGLAVSKVDSDAIERANDQIGRLGLISQYAGQQLAIALVPAMGRLAQVMTDSLREGGLLRITIDGLVNNLDVLAFSVGAVAAVVGGRFVAALAVSTAAMVKKALAAGVAATAMRALGVAVAFAGGPLGAVAALLGVGAAAAVIFGRDMKTAGDTAYDTAAAAAQLGGELNTLAGQDLPPAISKTVDLANANLTLARSAFAAADAQLALSKANLQASFNQMSMENAFLPGVDNPGNAIYEKRLRELGEASKALTAAQAELNARVMEGEQVKLAATEATTELTVRVAGLGESAGGAKEKLSELAQDVKRLNAEAAKGTNPLERFNSAVKRLNELKALGLTDAAYSLELERMNEELASSLPMVNDVANAFGDFVARGFKDFKGFTKNILSSFRNMLAQMIATAARNRIVMPIVASATGGPAAAAGAPGGAAGIAGTLASLGSLASGIGTGLSGVLGGGSIAAGVSGGFAAGGAAGIGTAIGAALPILAPLAIGAFFLNRRKKRRERRRAAEQQRIAAEQAEQQRLAQVAETAFGLDNRILELQGRGTEALTRVRERELAAIDQSLRPRLEQIFALEDMNRIMDERFGIENRLLELQGRSSEVLARNRQKELEATDASNRAILQQVFALEDQAEAAAAATDAIQRTMDLFRTPLALDSNRFADRYTATIQAAEDRRFLVQKTASEAQLTELKLVRAAIDELRRETRDVGLYGVDG